MKPEPQAPTTLPDQRSERLATAALSIGAFTMLAVMLTHASGVFDRTASADMASKTGSFTIMTTDAIARELVYVIDDREEMLLVYDASLQGGARGGGSLKLLTAQSLKDLFIRARVSTRP